MTLIPLNLNTKEPLDKTPENLRHWGDHNDYEVSSRADALAYDLGVDPAETRKQAFTKDDTLVRQANSEILKKNNPRESLEREVNSGGDVRAIDAALKDEADKYRKVSEAQDYYKVLGKTVDDPEINSVASGYYNNINIAIDLFSSVIADRNADLGVVGKTGHFIDRYFLRYLPIGMVEDITKRSERKGADLLQAAVTMSPEDYRTYIKEYIAELSDEGFLTGDNLFALQDGFQEALNSGYDPEANLNAALALGELALGVGQLAKSARLKRLQRAKTAPEVDAAVSGVDDAADSVAAATTNGVATDTIRESIVPSVVNLDTPAKRPSNGGTIDVALTPNTSRANRILDLNRIVEGAKESIETGAAGRVVDNTTVLARLQQIRKAADDKYANPVVDFGINTDAFDNKTAVLFLGTKKGNVFKAGAKRHAEKAASEIEGGTVVPVTKDGQEGFVVQVAQRINTEDLIKAEPESLDSVYGDIVREITSKYTGSARVRDIEKLSTLATQGEGVSSRISQLAKPAIDSFSALKDSDKRIVSRISEQLRDDPTKSFKREWYTREEFTREYSKLSGGTLPSEKVRKAWAKFQELSDAAWIFKANTILQRYIAQKGWAVHLTDEISSPGFKVDNVAEGTEFVYDAKRGYAARVGAETDEAKSIYKLDGPIEIDGRQVEYVMDPKSIRILEFDDVLGYNAGGNRTNVHANYFVLFADEGKRTKALMSTFSQDEATRAVDQLNEIKKARAKGTLTDEIVQKNNDWNPEITTVDELNALISTKKWDLDGRTLAYRARDEDIVDDVTHPLKGSTAADYISTDMRRMDEVLMEFGGAPSYNVDPLHSVVQSFGSAANVLAMRASTANAIHSWLATARRRSDLVDLNPDYNSNPYLQFSEAIVKGKSPDASRLKELQDIAKRRMGIKDDMGERMERFGQKALESLYGTTGLRYGSIPVADTLLKVGFQSAFGFFNVSQFFMQGFHAIAIMAMSPRHGIKGAGLTIPLRMALNSGKSQPEAMARLARASGLSIEDATELATYVKTSGRNIIDGDAIEQGTGIGYGMDSNLTYYPKKALDAGLVFFHQGERLSRLTGINTAFLEYKAKFPGKSALSDHGRSWITRREQDLTLNMTTQARSYLQYGPGGMLKVPTQWLSFSFRVMEAIAFGNKGLSRGERARLFLTLGPLFGTTGLGFANASDYFAESLGVKPDSGANVAIRYGLIDWVVGQTTGIDTAMASRLAPADAFVDLYGKILGDDKSFREVTLGPSGAIAGGALEAFGKVMVDAWHLRPVSLSEDAVKLLRQPSGIDSIAKAYGVYNNGYYQSKTGTYFPEPLKPSDIVQILMGFTPLEVVEFQQRRTQVYNGSKDFRAFSNEMNKKAEEAFMMIEHGGPDETTRGLQMLKEINSQVKLSGFSKVQMSEIIRRIWLKDPNKAVNTMRELMKQDSIYAARRLNQIMQESN